MTIPQMNANTFTVQAATVKKVSGVKKSKVKDGSYFYSKKKYTVDKQTPLLDFFTIFIENIPGDHSPGTSTNLYPTPHTVWIYSFVVTSRSFWRIFPMIQNTALLTSTGSSFQTAR